MVIIVFFLAKDKDKKNWKQLFSQIREDEVKCSNQTRTQTPS